MGLSPLLSFSHSPSLAAVFSHQRKNESAQFHMALPLRPPYCAKDTCGLGVLLQGDTSYSSGAPTGFFGPDGGDHKFLHRLPQYFLERIFCTAALRRPEGLRPSLAQSCPKFHILVWPPPRSLQPKHHWLEGAPWGCRAWLLPGPSG